MTTTMTIQKPTRWSSSLVTRVLLATAVVVLLTMAFVTGRITSPSATDNSPAVRNPVPVPTAEADDYVPFDCAVGRPC